ncbi:MAG: outer membrane lipoprotein-sorting protein [Spirochaetaceae bacterium]|nr:MAG: outer membrane lipoprotein-sorting protein [Spirochaetaceae bacterium]
MRKKPMVTVILGAVFMFAAALQVQAQITAEEIIRRMEANQVHSTSKSAGRMIITNRYGTRTKTFTTIARGEEKLLLEFTNKEERGQKILRTGDEIYLYYPDTQVVLRLQGGALKDSIFGSDLTYEDLTGEKGMLSLYKVELMESSPVIVDNVACWHLKLIGIKSVAYPFQEIWVDSNLFVLRKAAYYSLTNVLLKELAVRRIMTVSGRNFPSDMIMTDALKKGSSTEFIIESTQIDIPLPANQFSLERLSF